LFCGEKTPKDELSPFTSFAKALYVCMCVCVCVCVVYVCVCSVCVCVLGVCVVCDYLKIL